MHTLYIYKIYVYVCVNVTIHSTNNVVGFQLSFKQCAHLKNMKWMFCDTSDTLSLRVSARNPSA